MKLVSVIIPMYNAAPYIVECLESVVGQTYGNVEAIVVDDGSTDDSYVVAKAYAENHDNVTVVTQQNAGAAVARNKGLQFANGEYIQFLDADDKLAPEKIKSQMDYYESVSYDETVMAFGRWSKLGMPVEELSDNLKAVWHDYECPSDVLVDFALIGTCLPLFVYLPSRKTIDKAGAWNESLSRNDDGEFFARVISHTSSLRYVSSSLAYYRSTPNSLSKRMSDMAAWSQIRSLILTADILRESSSARKDEAVCKMLSTCLMKFYPDYKEQRTLGEEYLKKHYPSFSFLYYRPNWKERLYSLWKSL